VSKFEVKGGYFIGANGAQVELSSVVLPVVSEPSYAVRDFIPATASWSINMTRIQAFNAMRIFRLRRYHFAKYHVYKYECRRKAQP
jgi:predicted phosphatase